MAQRDLTAKGRPGVWTPWAAVLCIPCHNAKHSRRLSPYDFDIREHSVTRCDYCGTRTWVREMVARLHRLGTYFPDGAMDQTGGMCAAFRVPIGSAHYALVTIADEKEPYQLDFPYTVGLYVSDPKEMQDDCLQCVDAPHLDALEELLESWRNALC